MSTISTVEFNVAQFMNYDRVQKAYVFGDLVTGNLYTVPGVMDLDPDKPNELRKLSMGELVMVVCLARAAEKEAAVIDLMTEMSDTTDILNSLTDIETKLLAGTTLGSIEDTYSYQGHDYSAKEFLAIVVGGATPVVTQFSTDLTALRNQIANNHIVDVEGTYEYGGITYSEAYDYLYAMGISTLNPLDAINFRSTCHFADDLADGHELSVSELQQLTLYAGIILDSGATKEDLVQVIDDKYRTDILNDIQNKISLQEQSGYVSNPSSYLPSDKDELITQIESKMDSLNSFSQQKMIELQSETNKRDQAYDMITNILKSLNTVQVGIVNNI